MKPTYWSGNCELAFKKILEFFHWKTLKNICTSPSAPITEDRLPVISNFEESEHLGKELEREWRAELLNCKKNKCNPKLENVIFRLFWRPYCLSGILLLVSSVIRLCQPLLILKLIQEISLYKEPFPSNINMWTILMVLAVSFRFIFYKQHLIMTQTIGLKIRIAISYLIFQKLLLRKIHETMEFHPLNLLSNNVALLEKAMPHLHWLWVGPIFLIGTIIIMYMSCHYMVLICVSTVFVVFAAITILLGNILTKFRKTANTFTDIRLHLLSEVIAGIHIIKLYAWENAFQRLIEKARRNEVRKLCAANIVKGLFDSMFIVIDRLQIFFVFVSSTLINERLMTHQVFGIMLLLIVSRTVLTGNLPFAFSQMMEFKTCLDRIQSFLETGCNRIAKGILKDDSRIGEVIVSDVTAAWNPSLEILHNISLNLQSGYLCAVVGQVGSGKLPTVRGTIQIGGSISYASQEPWIFHGTVRDNILFGEEYESTRYDEVLRVCALQTDIEHLSHGDKTYVGERGVNLSGGQRARINLARAVYRKSDIYLLDDPLSAVDAEVSRHLFQECIITFLNGKTRIFVTHQIQNLPYTDHVVVVNEGTIQVQGRYEEVAGHGRFVNANEQSENEQENYKNVKNKEEDDNEMIQEFSMPSAQGYTLSDIWKYITLDRGLLNFVIYFLIILAIVAVFNVYVLICGSWSTYTTNFDQSQRYHYCLIVFYVLIATLVLLALRTIVGCILTLRTNTFLHSSMLKAMLGTNVQFFHCTPAGSLLAHFSDDISVLDEQFLRSFEWLIMIFLFICCNTCFIGIINQYTLISMIPLVIIIVMLNKLCTTASRNCKLIECLKRGKYFSQIADTLNGLVVIRCLEKVDFMLKQFHNHQNVYTSSRLLNIEVGVTQSFIVSLGAAIIIGVNTVLLMKTNHLSDTSLLGFAFLFTMFVEDLSNIFIEHLGYIMTQLPSIKSCLNMTHLTQEEKQCQSNETHPEQVWPTTGRVEFLNVSLQYNEKGPLILKNVHFSIKHREKIGVVGRTGAGKTSLVSALFRIARMKDDGCILVDSVDIRQLPLHVLRSKITVIPQEPVLFSGTIRDNLDPFNEMDDETLWNALKHVELNDKVSALDMPVTARGNNWSVGQKQLLCLARASLRMNYVVILDEATASIDYETDILIQTTIRNLFKDCTVITIAHRLNTIMDSDRVLVMDSGRILEFDSPYELLKQSNSFFYKMVQSSGNGVLELHKSIAHHSQSNCNETVFTRL